MMTQTLGVIAASLALLAPVAVPAAQTTRPAQNSSDYALTQIVKNETDHTLTVSTLRVDNGATIQDHDQTVAPWGQLAITATNHGNGIQMWLTMTSDDGTQIKSDGDIPKVNQNSLGWQIIGNPKKLTYGITDRSVETGDQATEWYEVSSVTPGGCSSIPGCTTSGKLFS